MGIVLKIVGALWALMGVGNLLMMNWTTAEQIGLMIGVVFNMLLFVLPGLALYGIGAGVRSTKSNA